MYREEWLNLLKDHLSVQFFMNGYGFEKKKIRISCGMPSKGAKSVKYLTLGECWHNEASADNTYEIFINPIVADSVKVGSVLAHELVHATIGVEHGHRRKFQNCAKAIGLVGPARTTVAGPELIKCIETFVKEVGKYPHATLNVDQLPKEMTRQLKVWCDNKECDYLHTFGNPYIVRQSYRAIAMGLPSCGCCGEVMRWEHW